MVLFPVFTTFSSKFSYRLDLDGITFSFQFYYNTREKSWYMSMADAAGSKIFDGLKLVPMYKLLDDYRALIPQLTGQLVLVDLSQNPATSDVTFDNYGERYILVYFSMAEVAQYGL